MTPRRRIIPVFVPHAGCGHECVFCDQRRISGACVPAAPSDVYSVVQSLNHGQQHQAAELAFYGGSFTAIPIDRQNELLEAAQMFLKLNPTNTIRISTRPDCLDEHIINRLKNYGVATIELGAQSMCDDVLEASQRGHTVSDIVRAAELVKASGLALILQMMTGLPEDTREKSLYTAKRFIELNPDGVRIYPTVIVRGTMLYRMWELGEYKEHTVEHAVELCAQIYLMFKESGIPVIRMGLNPSGNLSSGDAVAGAYHPAFGELVYSRIFYDKAVALLDGVKPGSEVTLAVAPGCVSIMTGQRRSNIKALISKFNLHSLKIVASDIMPGELLAK
jgi:histone acetyltransferase (RNA polymerase elongator complex component)